MPAHVGHWVLDLLYVLPVLVVVGFISVRALLDKRATAGEETSAAAPPLGDEPPAPKA